MIPVITIDGPSGSGKGTISQLLAQHLGWHFLDSGSLYRILAFAVMQTNVELDDTNSLCQLAANLAVQFITAPGEVVPKIILAGEDITAAIRTEECGAVASKIAAIPEVRASLMQRQRDFCQPPGLVADGRDMGTVVFPYAMLKIFLTASCEERARRRQQQLQQQGISVSLRAILQELEVRDARDQKRKIAPLKSAPDAIIIDTTHLTIKAVLAQVLSLM